MKPWFLSVASCPLWFCIACSGDAFEIEPGGGSGAETQDSTGGSQPDESGGSGPGVTTGGQGSGGETSSGSGGDGASEPREPGIHWGPELSDVDTTLGGMNGDLIVERTCGEFPQGMCAEIVGVIDSEPMSASCDVGTLMNDSGLVSCSAEGLTFALDLNMFTGAPPSSFDFTADPQQYPVTFSWVDAGFATHKDGSYASAETHEFSFRSTGVVYEEELKDTTRLTYVAGVFAVNWKKRPTCPTCPDVRLRGTFTVLTSD